MTDDDEVGDDQLEERLDELEVRLDRQEQRALAAVKVVLERMPAEDRDSFRRKVFQARLGYVERLTKLLDRAFLDYRPTAEAP